MAAHQYPITTSGRQGGNAAPFRIGPLLELQWLRPFILLGIEGGRPQPQRPEQGGLDEILIGVVGVAGALCFSDLLTELQLLLGHIHVDFHRVSLPYNLARSRLIWM